MKITFDCVPCIISHIVHMAKMITDNDEQRLKIVKQSLAKVVEADFSVSPPEQTRLFHRVIKEISGVDDPYREIKDQSTECALNLLPLLREELKQRGNQFDAIVRVVIGGNIIDYGANRNYDLNDVWGQMQEVFDLSLDSDAVKRLKAAMDAAEKIFYVADNCGEAVFDRLLIEPYRHKITLGVRGEPVLNDITPREIASSGLDIVPYLHTGDMTPGVSMQHSSKEFIDGMREADLVIAKGQGNFESLHEYDRPIFFLLRVKCQVIAELIGTAKLGDMQIISSNI